MRFARVPVAWLNDPRLSDTEFRLLVAVRSYIGPKGEPGWPANATLAADVGRSTSWTRRVLGELVRNGFVKRGKNGTGRRLLWCAAPAQCAADTQGGARGPRSPGARGPRPYQNKEQNKEQNPPSPPSQGGSVTLKKRDRAAVATALGSERCVGMGEDGRVRTIVTTLAKRGFSESALGIVLDWTQRNPQTWVLPERIESKENHACLT